MILKPLHDRVVIKIEEKASKTAGGIIIACDVDKSKVQEGNVVAVGKGNFVDGSVRKLDVVVGNKVTLPKGVGFFVKSDNEEYLIVRECEILAIINTRD